MMFKKSNHRNSEFLDYLLMNIKQGKTKLPSITTIADHLGISTANAREQIAIARALGLISVQPRTGIKILNYSLSPAIIQSLYFAVRLRNEHFEQFSELRNQIEKAFFLEAVTLLNENDVHDLQMIVHRAKEKLESNPIQIPHEEHKAFHLLIYKRIENVFLDGLLESYWEMYVSVGLNVYSDLSYLKKVWVYHQKIADAIEAKRYTDAYRQLTEHIDLLKDREIEAGSEMYEN